MNPAITSQLFLTGPLMKMYVSDDDQWLNTTSTSTFRLWFKDEGPEEAKIYLTTEDNSYGAILLRWFDGKVYPYTLQRGKHHDVSIAEVNAWKLKDCQATPYYHCMSQALSASKQCSKIGQPCTNISLPTEEKWQSFQLCTNQEATLCNWKVLRSLYYNKTVCKPSRLCHVQEYVTKQNVQPYVIEPKFNGFSFDYKFSVSESSGGMRTNEPTKQLHSEVYLVTPMGLVANIGGTLGLFIGFSFSGSLIWIIDVGFKWGLLFCTTKCCPNDQQAGKNVR